MNESPMNENATRRRRCHPDRRVTALLAASLLCLQAQSFSRAPWTATPIRSSVRSPTALNIWFFGGDSSEKMNSEDSCELVATRIEKPTPNSRRIFGEITVEAPIEDVWSILTDYDNLSTHVPNLVESRVKTGSRTGSAGDGSYTCRLYQKGAQKIVGFNFGASVTMDMVEEVIASDSSSDGMEEGEDGHVLSPREKKINFKCVESQFFSEFDGEWRVVATKDGDTDTTFMSYIVDVKPRGPVPVAALEWRIREDVPVNLRAVKKAAQGLEVKRQFANGSIASNGAVSSDGAVHRALNQFVKENKEANGDEVRESSNTRNNRKSTPEPVPNPVNYGEDETMAAYLRD